MPRSATFAMLKPDVTGSTAFLKILDLLRTRGFVIELARVEHLSTERAAAFYAEHRGKPFYDGLVQQMSSGPVIAMVLSREHAADDVDAVVVWRRLLGATDPTKAEAGTIRQLFGTAGAKNAAHGSDSIASAHREALFFFGATATPCFTDGE